MIDTPAPDANEKNPFRPSFTAKLKHQNDRL